MAAQLKQFGVWEMLSFRSLTKNYQTLRFSAISYNEP